jgi:mycoredoxin
MENNETIENKKVIMYGSPMCPMVPPVRGVLQRANAPFEYVNILEDMAGSLRVKEINDGNASVPTLVFPDGSTLTEPTTAVLRKKLETLGYTIPKPSLWQTVKENPLNTLMGTGLLLFGLYDQNWLFIGLGLILLAYIILASQR